MKKKIERNYLEINSIKDLNESGLFNDRYSVQLLEPMNFELNKFFYKNIGKNHHWVDRLTWTEKQWIDYVSDKKVKTYILKNDDDYVEESMVMPLPPSSSNMNLMDSLFG